MRRSWGAPCASTARSTPSLASCRATSTSPAVAPSSGPRCASFPPTSSIATTTICRELHGCDVMSSVDAARTEMSVLAGRLQQQYPKENEQTGVSVIRLRDGVSPQSRILLVALFGRGRVRAVDRVREPDQPPARPRDRPTAGDGRPHRARRWPRTSAAATADREPGGHRDRRCARSGAGRSDPADPLSPRAHRVADRRNPIHGRARRRVRDGPDDGDRCRVRHCAVAPAPSRSRE